MASQNLPSNYDLVSAVIRSSPSFASISQMSKEYFDANALPIVNNLFPDSQNGGMNEIVAQLINRIASQALNDLKLKNPLAMFEMSPTEFGATMEEYGVHRVPERHFRAGKWNAASQFQPDPINVDQALYRISRKSQYKRTIEDAIMRQAFLGNTGLSRLIGALLGVLSKSNNADTYIYMRRMLQMGLCKLKNPKDPNQPLFCRDTQILEVPDLRDEDLDGPDIRRGISRIIKMSQRMLFNSDQFNPLGRIQACDSADLICVLSLEAVAQNQVENLSQSFHTQYLTTNTQIIPVDSFEDPDVIGIILDRRAFGYHKMMPTRQTQSYDAQWLHSNHFLTLEEMYHMSPFCNFIYLVSDGKDNSQNFQGGKKRMLEQGGFVKSTGLMAPGDATSFEEVTVTGDGSMPTQGQSTDNF